MLFIPTILLFALAKGEDVRIDCHPETHPSQEECENRDCIWNEETSTEGSPICYMKPGIGYKYLSTEGDVKKLVKNSGPRNPWGEDFTNINFTSRYYGKTLNVKIFILGRFEPPLDLPRERSASTDSLKLETHEDSDPFYFTVSRNSTGRKLFDTSLGGLIFSDKFIQIVTKLPSEVMYGWGENVHPSLKHDFKRYTTWPMFARDEPPSSKHLETKNLYGVHPFYMMLEPDGKAHGVFILNSNAQEVTTAPGPALIYRTIGGNLDMYLFPGPTPGEVTEQYLALVGRPYLPAYWGLGYQISRYGYKDLDEMKRVIERNVEAGIPLDTAVADIDYMERYKDFTVDKQKWQGFYDYAEELHNQSMKLIPIFDAAIDINYDAFERAKIAGAQFIEWEREDQVPREIQDQYPLVKDTKIMLGVVWPDEHTAFPDFLDPTNKTTEWWIDEFVRFHEEVPYDGIWIDMNEPAVFGTNEDYPWYFNDTDHSNITSLKCPIDPQDEDAKWDMPPYKTHAVWRYEKSGQKSYLSTKTLCMCAMQGNGKYRLYDVKNLYGWSKAKATQQALYNATGKRGVVVTRSTFPTTGRYAGHWLGDNSATWEDLQSAVIGAQEFNMFGFSNHNGKSLSPQDPAQWSSVTEATIKANLFRYSYLPYLYSLFFQASMYGRTVIRPVFYEFPEDSRTYDLGHEFLWGSSMLIVPVLHEGATEVKAYLPRDDWYSLFDYKYGQLISHGDQTFPAPWDSLIPVLVRGGSILPRQKPDVTTEYTRKNAFELVIAPSRNSDTAKGHLYWDDGESIFDSFVMHNYYHWELYYTGGEEASLEIRRKRAAWKLEIPTFDTIEIFNYNEAPDFDSFKLNGQEVDMNGTSSYYDEKKKILYISKTNFIDMTGEMRAMLTWENEKTGDDVRFDCHPEPNANVDSCEQRGCIWKVSTAYPGIPHCYMKKGIGYRILSSTETEAVLERNDGPKNPWGNDIKQIKLTSTYIGKTLNVKIGVEGRYEPPLDLPRNPSESSDSLQLEMHSHNESDFFYFTVARSSTKKILFDTSLGGLIFSDQFIQIATKLPSEMMYGWGENSHPTLKHYFDRYTTWGMFARDEGPYSEEITTKNLYGMHPFYMMLETNGKAHGVFILNSNAQEITTAPGPALIYRTIGGNLDMYFFPGPTSEEVTQQYLALIGTPTLPAYWSLGFQISRWGYKNFAEMKEVVERNIAAGIPLDTVVGDIEYMDRYKDFSIGKEWEEFPAYVEQLHNRSMHVVLMFDPAVQANYAPFERAIEAGAQFVEWERFDQVKNSTNSLYPLVTGTKIMLGVVWPDNHTAFPDFLDPSGNTAKWWINELVKFREQIAYDGIWIDMNEPANFGTNEDHPWYFDDDDHPNIEPLKCPTNESSEDARWDMPPYKTHNVWVYGKDGSYLATKTLCMSAVQANGTLRHYDVKSLYGWSESKVTQQGQYEATKKRGIVISRSTFVSSGRYCGHWLGDNSATWEDLQSAVIGAQEFNMFGIPYIGSDICGFNRESEEELCLRWHQLGAFHPFMRNHNARGMKPQDPARWVTVAEAARKAILFRYSYLPYLFSLHFAASLHGGTVIRPVFYEYPSDRMARDQNYQFFWGSSLLIAPVVHKAGGGIFPRQKPNITTDYTRKNPFELLIVPVRKGAKTFANGFLYWDDGESVVESFTTHSYYHWTFQYNLTDTGGELLIIKKRTADCLKIPTLDTLEIFNYRDHPRFDSFVLDGEKVEIDRRASYYNEDKYILYITKKNFIDLQWNKHHLSWKNSNDARINCHPEPSATEAKCVQRGCLWKRTTDYNVPYCYMRQNIGYQISSKSGKKIVLKKNDGPKNPWGDDIKEITFTSRYLGKTLNVKIGVGGRYEPPLDLPYKPSKSKEFLKLETHTEEGLDFYFKVIRSSTKEVLFDTSIGGLIFSDQFIQIVTRLPSEAMYGWGENSHPTLKHRFDRYTTWAMFARDEWPYSEKLDTKNLYGMHPFYLMLEKDGKAHGVFILNSNAQEITTAPGPTLIYRTIGGNLDIYFFPGPTPEEVTQQYLALIGTPVLPAYWALGFQISRWGYKNFAEMKGVVERNIRAGIPFDTVVGDIDYMDRYKDFTFGEDWKQFPAYVDKLHNRGMRVVLMFDPAVQVNYAPFERAIKSKAQFVEWERHDQVMNSSNLYPLVNGTKIMLGVVWPDNHTAFPDFLDPSGNTAKWWIDELVRFREKIAYDGIWIDMNEPANFGTNEKHPWYFDDDDHPNIEPLKCPTNESLADAHWDMPPYKTHNVWAFGKDTESYLATKTLCMLAVQANGTLRHYDVKSLYGWSESKVTLQGQYKATKRRGIVISRSTFASSGRYCGHWLGDNSATWEDLQSAVIGAQEFNLFGIPYIGSDICGFNRETEEELCLRWHQMGAFHTFMRNHNSRNLQAQDPARWPTVAKAAKKATLFRYSYLPYLFSLHFVASLYGGTVIRPVFYEYPTDNKTHNISYEFLWGSSMLIAPVLHKGAQSVQVYLPKDDWYSLFDYNYGELVPNGDQIFPAPWDYLIPVFVRGGAIIPCQTPNTTTEYTRQNSFKLIIAPGTREGAFPDTAHGFLYWDDGESIVESFTTHPYYHWTFHYSQNTLGGNLTIQMERNADNLSIPTLDILEIFNYKYPMDLDKQVFMINGKEVSIDKKSSRYDDDRNTLYIAKKHFIDMTEETIATLTWRNVQDNSSSSLYVQTWLLVAISFLLFVIL
ncbi:unnamed protein product [Cylicocyclus nassatus]|uniref:Maltase n=1 Tax=Cylicocyclus nassatus TaxID=53992 RepID=A0AA36GU33_CYLNA|nr:unnamed protein product [Cylicocyclus nassatus]